MFKKLLSNLPFNPSLINEISFYSKRLKKESSIRRVGFVFVALTLVVQVFAVITPAEASNKCNTNDIIYCGFKTHDQANQLCANNTTGFRTILEYYGITCATLAAASTQTVNSNSYNGKLFSMGRHPYQKPGEYATNISGAGTFYLRPLTSWGKPAYKMLVTKTPDGMPFMVIYDCGNIVIQQGYTPPPKEEPAAVVNIAKVNEPKSTVKPGDTIKYTLAFTNTGGTAYFFSVNDRLGPELELVSTEYNGWIYTKNGQHLKWANNTPPFYTFGNTDVFGTPGFITVTARVKAGTPAGKSVCNSAWIEDIAANTTTVRKTKEVTVCNKVVVDCPPGTIAKPNGECETPEKPKPEEKNPILAIEKKAKNITQNIEDANGTTAAAGDIIEYTLITKNYGNGDAKDTLLKPEELSDVLEYADLDLNFMNGAILDKDTNNLTWSKPVTIKPDQSVTKTFRVKVKNPIPQTPAPVTNPGSYDLVMTNVYGNAINIKLTGGTIKTTEQVTQTLPNTGPGEALAAGFIITTVAGYFFARSRLMSKELQLVKQEYTSGG